MSSVTGNSRALSEQERRLIYALEKQVPSMRNGFKVLTAYGEIWFDGPDAAWLEFEVELLLSHRLRALQEQF